MDFASLLFQAPAPAQPRTTVGAGDAPVGSSELAFEAGGLTEDDQATEEESSGIDDTDDTDSSGTERSEEHTSELQSRGHLVCRLLLEKKKTKSHDHQA